MICKKRKEIVLDCFTFDRSVYEFTPVDYLINSRPRWWSKLKTKNESEQKHLTMKSCSGLIESFGSGFYLPMWADLKMEIDSTGFWYDSNPFKLIQIDSHCPSQWGEFLNNKKHHQIKMCTPWLIRSKSKTKFLVISAMWNGMGLNDFTGFNILSGVVDFYFQQSLNINVVLTKTKKPVSYEFKINQPLVYVIPLSENKIKIKKHLITKDEFNDLKKNDPLNKMDSQAYYRYKKEILNRENKK